MEKGCLPSLVTYRCFLPYTAQLRFVMAGGKKEEEKRFSDLVSMLLEYCNKRGANTFLIVM